MLNIIAGIAYQGKTLKLIDDLMNIEPGDNVTNCSPPIVIFTTRDIGEVINRILFRVLPTIGEIEITRAGFFEKYHAVVSYFLECKKYELVFFDSVSDTLSFIKAASSEINVNSIWIDYPIKTLDTVHSIEQITHLQALHEVPINITHGLNSDAVNLTFNTEHIPNLDILKKFNVEHFSCSRRLFFHAGRVDFVKIDRPAPREEQLMVYTDKIRNGERGDVREYTVLSNGALAPLKG